MTLKYHWENQTVNVETQGLRSISPHSHQETTDIDYEYERDVDVKDIVRYIVPNYTSKEQKELAEKVVEEMIDLFQLNLGDLKDDECFVEFMKDRYEDEAYDEFKENNYPY